MVRKRAATASSERAETRALPTSLLREEGEKQTGGYKATWISKNEQEMLKVLQTLPTDYAVAVVYIEGKEAPLTFVRYTNHEKKPKRDSVGGWVQEGTKIQLEGYNYIAPTAVVMGNGVSMKGARLDDFAVLDSCSVVLVEIGKHAMLIGTGDSSTLIGEKITAGQKKYLTTTMDLVPQAGDVIFGGLSQNNLSVPDFNNSPELQRLQVQFDRNRPLLAAIENKQEDAIYGVLKPATDFRVKSNDAQIVTVKAMMALVNMNLKYKIGWAKTSMFRLEDRDRSIDDALRQHEGVCFEQATACAIMLRQQGVEAYLVVGEMKNMYKKGLFGHTPDPNKPSTTVNHAWVKAYIDGKEYVVDPTNMIFAETKNAQAIFLYAQHEESYLSDHSPIEATQQKAAAHPISVLVRTDGG